jgi:hypothetical protein
LQEIVKFSRGKVIKYNQVYNKPGTLARIPSAKKLEALPVHMCKKESFLDETINIITPRLMASGALKGSGVRQGAICHMRL